ncbi:MAG: hypothetical protein U1G05_05045 [Kiritimatiellia bacterium]
MNFSARYFSRARRAPASTWSWMEGRPRGSAGVNDSTLQYAQPP